MCLRYHVGRFADDDRRAILVGWDGAEWSVISPLLDAGRMPNLERLINAGGPTGVVFELIDCFFEY